MQLFQIILPKSDICKEAELYFRVSSNSSADKRVLYNELEQSLKIEKGSVVSFDTYFNCFSYSKYLKYTQVSSLGICLNLKGKFLIRLVASRLDASGQKSEILQGCTADYSGVSEVKLEQDFSEDQTEGIYYIELTALDNGAVFYGGYYFTDEKQCNLNTVKVAAVICTYRRESFVYRNLANANAGIFDNPAAAVKENLSFFVVDNGHTIDKAKIENSNVKVFENKNYGGSGGFTRGIIEAYMRKNVFTHVLLMDDDIVFETETLTKTINILKLLKKEHVDTCIGAGMLREDLPYLQHEAGAVWKGMHFEGLKSNVDLRAKERVILNEREEKVDYSAWWYMCIPLSLIDDHNLPLPLFIKVDDIEYAVRLSSKILLLNGVGIWHKYFDQKYSVHFQYYVKRNSAILAAIHYPQVGALSMIKRLLLAMGKQHLKRRYSAHDFILRAYDDFLKGIDFLLETDEEKLNTELIKKSKAPSHDGSVVLFPYLMLKYGARFISMSIRLIRKYARVAESYRERREEVTSMDFWCRHLEIYPERIRF